ncbi:5-(carboxyamino)imidazole ribonucleotide synthase [Leptospira sp. GIMC2001]|uniref:5-(carboxyamino)imidazole ribonucleotide synthase n=1 Tax=Leptospira sp. GIMC2001 TaxID=1513297 RepID=UPI00234AB225|nr:5-(carboxyamino)imidazole ribonucleotide synthase [Leptospira sp. GIMC2001]WCL47987.1 5-(carboxyamino)imidazole ribonucleotide synthase [Leptospira sp. GIMC2001]
MIYPKRNLGILGSGQLGRMFTQSASKMGYNVLVYSQEKDSPSSKVGASPINGDYEDFEKLGKFIENVDAVSFEFENITENCLKFLLEIERNRGSNFFMPSPSCILLAQDRILEKEHFQSIGIPTVPFLVIRTGNENWNEFSFPAILKTTRFGYDGKGQWKFSAPSELTEFLKTNPPNDNLSYILEKVFPFEKEISVIYARDSSGKEFIFPPGENLHKNHILDTTKFPAEISDSIHDKAIQYASLLGRSINYYGVFGIEFFVLGEELVANEFAPRPHNSGHFSMDASNISQFELQLRVLTGQTLPDSNQVKPCIMKNILGDQYDTSINICMDLMSLDSRYHLHLYQKDEAKPGRKMGHINFVGPISEVDSRFWTI